MQIKQLLAALILGTNEERQRAETILAETQNPRVRRAICHGLFTAIELPAEAIQEAAVLALLKVGDDEAVALLVQRGDYFLERHILKACRGLRNRRAVSTLLMLLETNPFLATREILEILVEIGDPTVAEPLILSFAKNDIFDYHLFVDTLAAFGSTVIPSLLKGLEHEDRGVRDGASATLVRIGTPASEPLVSALSSLRPLVRAGAAKALGQILGSTAIDMLQSALGDEAPSVVSAAASAVGKIGDTKATGSLLPLLSHSDPEVRAATAEALGDLESAAAIDGLIEALADDHPWVRDQAVASLALIGPVAAQPLFTRFQDTREYVRLGAAAAIASIEGDEIEFLLSTGLVHDDWRVRHTSLASLSMGRILRNESTMRAVIATTEDQEAAVRRAAASALAGIAPVSAERFNVIEVLTKMLVRPHELARRSAAEALLRLYEAPYEGRLYSIMRAVQQGPSASAEDERIVDRTRIVDVLLRMLQHPTASIRLVVIQAIDSFLNSLEPRFDQFPEWFGLFNDEGQVIVSESAKRLVQALVKRTQDEDAAVRRAALAALVTTRTALERERLEGEQDVYYSRMDWPPNLKPYPLAEERQASAALLEGEAEAPDLRYADATLYTEGQDGNQEKHDAGQSLIEEQSYRLVVAIRLRPTGIPLRTHRQPIVESAQQGPIKIIVTVEARGFRVQEPVQTLILPPIGDSTSNAWFKVAPMAQAARLKSKAQLRVRLYHEFCLLEVLIVEAEVRSKFTPVETGLSRRTWLSIRRHPLVGRRARVTVLQERWQRGYEEVEKSRPRAMHVDITKRDGAYLFTFTLRNSAAEELVLTAPIRLLPSDLEDRLVRARQLWCDIAMRHSLSRQPTILPDEELVEDIRYLAETGRQLWITLFKQHRRGASGEVGEWLQRNPPEDGSLIQISVEPEAADFVFPWALLYDRTLPERPYQPIDPAGFWGLRYRIEQELPRTTAGAEKAIGVENGLRIAFMLWDQFRNSAAHRKFWSQLAAKCGQRLEVSDPPVNDVETCYEQVLTDGALQVLYFYAHGHSRGRLAAMGGVSDLDVFIQRYERLEPGSPLLEVYRFLYEAVRAVQFEPDRSWIALTYGKLYLDVLYDKVSELVSHPLVFLNMCESAQLSPALSESFVQFFLDRGARCVLGTEGLMTVDFAHDFAEAILTDLLAGRTIGEALLSARRHFMAMQNPLGLAYSLFGSAETSFQPALLMVGDQ
jgi:HEAT repeat protein